MEKPEFIVTPGFGERFRRDLHFSTAVKIGDRIETSGQGGWNDDLEIPESIEEEIATAFRNIDRILVAAGATWGHVVHVNSYHVGGFPPIVKKRWSSSTGSTCQITRRSGRSWGSRL